MNNQAKHGGERGAIPAVPARILFVEDDPAILELQLMIMRRLGYEALGASSGEEGFELMLREQPDVAVLDVMLPGCDGYTLAQRIRSNPALQHTPIAFVSARREGEDFARGFAAGGQLYLSKPFTTRALRITVESLLKPGGIRQTGSAK